MQYNPLNKSNKISTLGNSRKPVMTDATIFWPLKKGIPSEEELVRLADNIQQDWKRIGVALGLKEKALKAIEVDITNDVYERALAVLQKWKKKMGRKATYRKLAAAFNDQLVQRPALVKTFSSDTPDNNIWMIKKGTPTEQELQRLAEEIPEDWKRLGRAVGLKEKHLKIIEIDNPDNVFERALATLFKWKEKQGQEATYQKLATALDDELVQRRDLVETFCCDIYPNSDDTYLPGRRDTIYQEEDVIRNRRQSTRLLTELKPEEPINTEPELTETKEDDRLSFQETLQTWKRRESARASKDKAPSFRWRQSKMKDAQDKQVLEEEVHQIKDMMDAAMQRMSEILERVHHKPPNTTAAIPVNDAEVIKETDGGSLEDADFVSEADGSFIAVQDENMDQTDEEDKRQIERTSVEFSSDPYFMEWPWISVVFTSSWGQWFFGSDEK